MSQMSNIVKQVQQMQQKVVAMKKELEARELEITSEDKSIKITINGKQEIQQLKISQDLLLLSDHELIEETIRSNINKAIGESQLMVSKAMEKITGPLSIPGLF